MRAATATLVAGSLSAVLTMAITRVASSEESSIARGSGVVALGNGKGAVACASCHSFDGAADPSGGFPRLTGQTATYLSGALDSFADGHRRNAIMSPIATAMSQEERTDVAAYYASMTAPIPPAPPVADEVIAAGRSIATIGLDAEQIPACAACHGPFGRSVTPTIPSLGGQYGRYIEFELRMFRDGVRKSGAASMGGIAHSLTDRQAQAVAAYLQRAPGPTGPTSLPRAQSGADAARTDRP